MHVFCPDCNAEYKVDERSSLTKTVKFICVECESSWIDKFEKLEQTKELETASQEFNGDVLIENKNEEIGIAELNSLALEEVQNSFGNNKNRVEREEEPKKLTSNEIAHAIISTIEMDSRGFIPELNVWATNPF